MGYRYTSTTPKQQVKMCTEKVKVLKVIGEQKGQLVVESKIPINAIKIDRVQAELRDITDHLFIGKVVKQGIVHKQIYYVTPDDVLKCTFEESPFMLAFEIPGLIPSGLVEVQNHVLDISSNYTLQPECETPDLAMLQLKIVAHILVTVAEWTHLDVVTKVDVFPKHY